MEFEERIRVKATPEQIFHFYENVSEWHTWDTDVQSSSIDGEFKLGAKGKLKPAKGPEVTIEIVEVTKNKSCTTLTKLPLCTLRFMHELVPLGEETEVLHKVLFSGLLAPVFSRLIGVSIKKSLPATLLGLRSAIESKS